MARGEWRRGFRSRNEQVPRAVGTDLGLRYFPGESGNLVRKEECHAHSCHCIVHIRNSIAPA
jgi:hypothetical protein